MLSHRIARANSGSTSVEARLWRGFPQGGVLSALMWILVADRLLELLKKHGYLSQGFADDFSVLVEGIDLSTVCNIGQFAVLQIEKWCKTHGLSVNPIGKNTEMVLFRCKRKLDGFKPIQRIYVSL